MNENVNVCITPKGEKPVLHFSQFDNENVFTVTVLADDGESAAVLTGLDIEFRLRKTDSHVVTIAPESVADNVITFKTTEQMCACCGQNIATVTLMKDDMVISTLDILVDIQRDILSGGLTSESDIRNLTTQIEQIVPEVVGDDYYNKQEVDDLLAEHTFDPTNYYDKSDVDGLLADKADSDDVYTKSDVYNKTETDNLLADKANISDVYAKTEVNNLLSAKMDTIGYHGIVDDAAVISFTTDCNAPLDIIKGKITPVQSGSGTPSPQNVRPISGFSALNVTRTGVNLVNIPDKVQTGGGYLFSNYSINLPQGTYTLSFDSTANSGQCNFVVKKDNTSIGSVTVNLTTGRVSLTVTITQKSTKIECYANTGGTFSNIQLEFGNQTSEYHAYNGQTATVNLGQTVYGGSLDVTNGKLKITHKLLSIDNNSALYSSGNSAYLNISDAKIVNEYASAISDKYEYNTWSGATNGDNGYFTLYQNTAWSNARLAFNRNGLSLADFITSLTNNPIEVVYELATPTEITTTPETVLSIAGDNNIFLDTGNLTEIAYFEGAEDNLIKLIKACQI